MRRRALSLPPLPPKLTIEVSERLPDQPIACSSPSSTCSILTSGIRTSACILVRSIIGTFTGRYPDCLVNHQRQCFREAEGTYVHAAPARKPENLLQRVAQERRSCGSKPSKTLSPLSNQGGHGHSRTRRDAVRREMTDVARQCRLETQQSQSVQVLLWRWRRWRCPVHALHPSVGRHWHLIGSFP